MSEMQQTETEVKVLSLREGMKMSAPRREHVGLTGLKQCYLSEITCIEVPDRFSEDEGKKKTQYVFKYLVCENPAIEIKQYFGATNNTKGNLYKFIRGLGIEVTETARNNLDSWLGIVESLKGKQYLVQSEEKNGKYNMAVNVMPAQVEVPVSAAKAAPQGDAPSNAMTADEDLTFETDEVSW